MNKKYILICISAIAIALSIFSDGDASFGSYVGDGTANRFIGNGNNTGTGEEICHLVNENTNVTYTQFGTDAFGWYNQPNGSEVIVTQSTNTGFYIDGVLNNNASIYHWQCIFQNINSSITGATGPVGATGATGGTGSDGWSAYQVAVMNGYSGTVMEWLGSLIGPVGATGATGSVILDLSGSMNIQNSINMSDSGVLDTNGLYLPISVKNNGTTYIEWGGVRNIIILIGVFILFFYFLYVILIRGKNTI